MLTGTVAANHSGPAITLSLLVAAFGGGLAALCYSEFAAFLPVPGSAYSYTYATLGEALAWFIGWNLLLEYAISASAVAVSWSAYVVNLLDERAHPSAGATRQRAARAGRPRARDPHGRAHQRAGRADRRRDDRAAVRRGARLGGRQLRFMVALKVGIIIIIVIAGLSVRRHLELAPLHSAQHRRQRSLRLERRHAGRGDHLLLRTSASIPPRPPRSRRATRSATCRSASSARWSSRRCCTSRWRRCSPAWCRLRKLDSDAPVAVALDAHPQLTWLSPTPEDRCHRRHDLGHPHLAPRASRASCCRWPTTGCCRRR